MNKFINKWLKENTKGFKKGFDKDKLIFSYNDILELDEELNKKIINLLVKDEGDYNKVEKWISIDLKEFTKLFGNSN